jgi:hypothetical protein
MTDNTTVGSEKIDKEEVDTDIYFSDMKMRPELSDDEEVLFSVSGTLERAGGKAVMTGTNNRLIVGPKKGSSGSLNSTGSDSPSNPEIFEVRLDKIEALRRSGWINKELEVETYNKVIELPTFPPDSADVAVTEIVKATNLERSEWDEEQREDDTSADTRIAQSSIPGIAGIIGGVTGGIFGIMFILTGLLFCLTIIGVIIGAPLIYVGLLILSASGYLTGGGAIASLGILRENRDEEWVRKDTE